MTAVCSVEGCVDCVAELRYRERLTGPHVCGELCELTGASKRQSPEFHSLIHTPMVCEYCGRVLDDHQGHGSYSEKLCRAGWCTVMFCPECKSEWGSSGPSDCPACHPMAHLPYPWHVSAMHARYRRKKRSW